MSILKVKCDGDCGREFHHGSDQIRGVWVNRTAVHLCELCVKTSALHPEALGELAAKVLLDGFKAAFRQGPQ